MEDIPKDTAVSKDDSKEDSIKLESINESSQSTTVTTPTSPGIHVPPRTEHVNNRKSTPKGKQTEDTKGTSKRKHIIIITSMICTFVGSASGLIVLYSHLNEKDAREAIESSFLHSLAPTHQVQPTVMETCTSLIMNCFNVSDYFMATTPETKCSYLESVGECVLERRDIETGQNCSELIDMVQSVDASMFVMGEAYLQVDIRQCSFYNDTAVEELRKRGHAILI